MKNNFSYRSPHGANDRRSRRPLLIATAIVIFLLLINVLSGGKLSAGVRAFGSVLWQAEVAIATRISLSGIFATRAQLAGEVQSLQEQLALSQERAAAYDVVEFQDQQLSSLVHLAQSTPGLTAPVISSFTASPYGTFSIGAGSADGVESGALVLTEGGFVIGRVSDVSSHQALVSEIFAPRASVEVTIDGIPLQLSGEGGGNAQGSAPYGSSIAVDDPALSPSLGQRSVGIVGEVEGNPASASTQIYVRLPINLESLSFVYIENSPALSSASGQTQ